MTQTYDLEQIQSVLEDIELTSLIEEGFVAYSQGKVVVPPIGELIMTDPPGEAHIKYGYITYEVSTTLDARDIPGSCNLIVCVTPSTRPLVQLEDVHPGTHITAIGSDTPEKQEVDTRVLAQADIVVVDSIPQSELRGEVYKATTAGVLEGNRVLEIGNVIVNKDLQRQTDDQLTVFDSTGVAVQDIQVAKAVYHALSGGGKS